MEVPYCISVLNGPPGTRNGLSDDTQARVRTAPDEFYERPGPIYMIGSNAEKMKDALGLMPFAPNEDQVWVETESRDTVSNALFAKRTLYLPNGDTGTRLITAKYHLRRSGLIVSTVMGPGFEVVPIAAPNAYSPAEAAILTSKEIPFTLFALWALRGYDSTSSEGDEKVLQDIQRVLSLVTSRMDG